MQPLSPEAVGQEQVGKEGIIVGGAEEPLVIGGKKHNKTYRKKRHGNKSLTAWVKFVKKVAREEKLPYRDAMMRAKARKDKGEKWMSGGAQGEPCFDENGNEGTLNENNECIPNTPTGGRRRRTRRGSKRSSRRGSKKRRCSKRRR